MQRDHYMPLKVIRQHLEDLEAGRVLNSMPATVSEDVLDTVLGPNEQEGRTYISASWQNTLTPPRTDPRAD